MFQMRILIFIFICLPILGFGQAEEIFAQAEKRTITSFHEAADELSPGQFRILLHMGFGESDILNYLDIVKVFSGSLESIRLYYSDFPKGRNFDQLNTDRIESFLLETNLLNAKDLDWKIVKQTACKNLGASQ